MPYICSWCRQENVDDARYCVHCSRRQFNYEPTPEEIRTQCLKIQETWSEQVEQSHVVGSEFKRKPPTITGYTCDVRGRRKHYRWEVKD